MLTSPIVPSERALFRPRGRGLVFKNSTDNSEASQVASVGGLGMDIVSEEILDDKISRIHSWRSSVIEQFDEVAGTLQTCSGTSQVNSHDGIPTSINDGTCSASTIVAQWCISTRSSIVSGDCNSQTSCDDFIDFDLPEYDDQNVRQLIESAHRNVQFRSNCYNSRNIARHHGPTPCFMAPKLPPARQRETVIVKTNIYPLEVESRIVYRYDVRMYASRVDTSKERTTDLCKGDKDDSEVTLRHRKCMLLMKRALELYRILDEGGAYLYDLTSTLFTNEPLDKDLLPRLRISMEQLTPELRSLIGTCDVFIEITPCTESAHTFNVTDYFNSITNNLARQDRSFRQFFEILTNNSALQKGTHYAFGCGKLFLVNGKRFKLEEQSLREGRTLVCGVDKGIRFIERSNGTIFPALVIDSKKTAFFDAIPLSEMVRRVLMKNDSTSAIPPLDSKLFGMFVCKLNDIIRDLRLEHMNCSNKSFVASGLSDKPVGQIRLSVGKKIPQIPMLHYYKQQGYRIRADWPAVRLVTNFGTSYFPIEVLRVAPCQRVPLSKQTASQMKDAIKECAVLPQTRFRDIGRNLEALDLDESTCFNPFMAAFGVRISSIPVTVEAHRRLAPKVRYSDSRGGCGVVDIDSKNANWRMIGRHYLVGAQLHCWFIFYDNANDQELVMTFAETLVRECQRRGIYSVDPVIKNVEFKELENYFKEIHHNYPKEQAFVIYIDSRDDSHDELKLYEVLYHIITQHIHAVRARDAPRKVATLENIINKLNCKNFGQCYGIVPESFATNKWISTGKTLIIGYDVCHPEPQPKHERRMRITPTQPSVLGISFNGALCPETFIGDYSFQEPRKEQVTSSILEERIYWILSLFTSNRNGMLPETVIITRDGVSEGQFKMVMEEEIEAIRQGMRRFGKAEAGLNNYSPNIVCIIACKRHNKRFAIENGRSLENCLPLTVIDKDITRPDTTEFFMQSHKIIKGSGKLPAYSMPVNEANLTMDEAQSLMMALCFTHQIVNQAISIPEPIYQADEWAKRGRNNFRAMLRRVDGKMPTLSNGSIDWNLVTRRLCYMDTALQLTRCNA